LDEIPCIIRPIPVNSNPNEIKNTIISKANNGKAMGRPDIAIAITPSTILPMRDSLDPPEEVIPTVILSIPKNIKAIENRSVIVKTADNGLARTAPENTIAIIPAII
jgi:hypothetical protein